MYIEVGFGSHTGLKRAHNEDHLLFDAERQFYLVADGMGGLESGEIASSIACDTVARDVRAETPLPNAISNAHAAILHYMEVTDPEKRMGTTIVALKTHASDLVPKYEIAWVGDSRIYLFEEQVLRQISHDHSYVQELVDRNLITPEEAKRSPHKNLVTQALGAVASGELKVDFASGHLAPGQQLLLCSDGLTGEVDDTDIADILAEESTAQDAVDSLIQAALNGGGSDNITVVLLRLKAASPSVPS
jgi:PPM family protein phosphatase